MNKIATLMLCACFITVLFPQPGYIHPDEFFQSTEVVAGDVLQVAHVRAWEFNSTLPIRSMVFPYLLTAPSLYLLRWMNTSSFSGFKISAVKVVMATRLPVAFLSIFGYLATGRLASHFGVEKWLSTVLWCTSYVFWSYYTRTFSNSVESFLLALLFLLTMNSTSLHRKPGKQQKRNLDSEKRKNDEMSGEDKQEREGGKTTVNREDGDFCSFLKVKSFLLGTLVAAGFFNRPTFLLFSVMPIIYWFFSLQRKRRIFEKLSLLITIALYAFLGVFFAFFIFVSTDTLYYNADFIKVLREVFHVFFEIPFSLDKVKRCVEIFFPSLVITPWNFLMYNIDSSNLAQHGLHPRYTHFLVNLPLLIGPLYVPFIAVCVSCLYLSLRRCSAGTYPSAVWLVLMALMPILGLSIFPHQEPRFLIPLLPVFIVTGAKIVSAMMRGRQAFMIMWMIFNIVLHLIYGYFHQAAVIPVLSIYQQRLSSSSSRPSRSMPRLDHMIFYKTYTPPHHLLLLHESRSEVQVHDLAGAQFKVLMKLVGGLERDMLRPGVKGHVYVFLPATASAKFLDRLTESESDVSSSSICPHLSTESLPRFKEFWRKQITFDDFLMDFCLTVVQISAKD